MPQGLSGRGRRCSLEGKGRVGRGALGQDRLTAGPAAQPRRRGGGRPGRDAGRRPGTGRRAEGVWGRSSPTTARHGCRATRGTGLRCRRPRRHSLPGRFRCPAGRREAVLTPPIPGRCAGPGLLPKGRSGPALCSDSGDGCWPGTASFFLAAARADLRGDITEPHPGAAASRGRSGGGACGGRLGRSPRSPPPGDYGGPRGRRQTRLRWPVWGGGRGLVGWLFVRAGLLAVRGCGVFVGELELWRWAVVGVGVAGVDAVGEGV